MLWGRGVQGPTGPDLHPIYGTMNSKSRYPIDKGRINTTCPLKGLHPYRESATNQRNPFHLIGHMVAMYPDSLNLKHSIGGLSLPATHQQLVSACRSPRGESHPASQVASGCLLLLCPFCSFRQNVLQHAIYLSIIATSTPLARITLRGALSE